MQTRPTMWILAGIALLVLIGGLLYASSLSIPAGLAWSLAIAFALEACLYSAAMLADVRARLEARFRPARLALWMTLSGLAPYCVYTVPNGLFDAQLFVVLAAASAAVSYWFVAFPPRRATEFLFVAFVAAVLLSPVFPAIYGKPWPKLQLGILGQLMWTRLAALAALSIARLEVKGFGLLPNRAEWKTGALHFLMFLPAGALLGWATGFASFHLRPGPWWETAGIAAATFVGMLWVVALREEFFFRGLLQPWLGLIATSLLFGLVHLPFREFPNWRFAILAAVAGVFYGLAYRRAGSVRAAMVTHALVNTAWRIFFF
ncbi:MAG TPA: CPBP family intramembrane glutamic endopeptidase [Bryobacteraceae bacterium]